MEREVIGHFADLMHLPQDQAWGYVTSGGTGGGPTTQVAPAGERASIPHPP